MLSLMEPEEWDELIAYYEDEPFGPEADDIRAAKLAAVHEPKVDVTEFLKTPGERRRELEEAAAGPTAEQTDALFSVLMARQRASGGA